MQGLLMKKDRALNKEKNAMGKLMTRADAIRFGFEWNGPDERYSPLQVTRTAAINRGRRDGVCRVVSVRTVRSSIDIYVSRTGQLRIFKDHEELK